ncbi:hypothetical protein [Actinoallomurus iriomotensis]|uniref:Knr4/Smi1-like domain-containing protein n=1 Tax=Actinoallomurus iriomotensis TaxID=478107 RepID=A0A9W6W2P8_9ACTN|nr:hypothetical protein [Actinoallomurus iriomotensis]GLY88087.1 hypothetical protein Airi02_060160 [Actinoallomurus iriomotensis]
MERASDDALAGLSTDERVRACLAMVSDGTTASHDDIQGLSGDLIRQVNDDQPAPLPFAYRCFLEHAGAGAGRFLQGCDVFHPDVLGLRRAADELLAGRGLTLTDADRVILMHQGVQFDFLHGDGEDPEVWSYCEDDTAPALRHARFTDWLFANVREQTHAWAHLAHWPKIS